MPIFISYFMKYLLIMSFFFFSCSEKNNKDAPPMSDEQRHFLEQQYERSFDINSSMEKGFISLEQEGELEKLSIDEDKIIKIGIELPESISTPIVYEADNLFYIYNAVLSNDDNNIAVLNKNGNEVSLFGKKGRGPQEFSQIDAILKMGDTTLVFDNGYLKKFDGKWSEFDRNFMKLWVKDAHTYKEDYVVRLSDNRIFPFPIALVDAETDSIIMVIKDERPGALNFSSGNGTTFYSNDEYIFYAKTTLDYLHFIPVDDVSQTLHYRLKSQFIRENSERFDKENSNPEKFFEFITSLFLIEKIFVYNDIIWLSFVDRQGDFPKYYLGKIKLKDLQENRNVFSLFETTESLKHFNFYEDHIFYSSRDSLNKLFINIVYLKDL